jgi:20S proteasome alpha/beta subunit
MKRLHGLDDGSDLAGSDLGNWDIFHPSADAAADAMPAPASVESFPGNSLQIDGVSSVLDVGLSAGLTTFDPASGMASLLSPITTSDEPITNSAISASGATAAQVLQALNESGLSVNGFGIKVGVISDSFNNKGGAGADEASGALPSAANIQVLEDYSGGGTDEGRAMMQIVHEIAPGASLAFYTADFSEQDFANGILALAAAGCKVICDDVSYFDEPFFQNGVIAQAIQRVEAEGVTYITSAGNEASNGYQAAWSPISGSFVLAGQTISLTDAQNFGGTPFQAITVNSEGTGIQIPLLLEWDQAYGTVSASTADLELLVYNSSGQLLGTVTNAVDGEPTNPWVGVRLPATGTSTATYYIAIENLHPSTNPRLIKEITFGDGLPVTISGANSGTVVGHAMTPGVITAGAVNVASTPAFGVSPARSETFSSSGAGAELLFANDGTRLASPQALNPVVVSGLDNIATTVPGGLSDFFGTSAASASLAGVAALIMAANPNLTPAQVEQIIQQTALPMANSSVSGAGLVNVDAAVAAAQALANFVIEAIGNTELVQQGTSYLLDPVAGGTGPSVKYQGSVVTAGAFNGWAPIGAEQLSGGGYEIAWHNVNGNQYWVWSADSNGNFTGNLYVPESGSMSFLNPDLEALEPSFQQDLDGDGIIGPTTIPFAVEIAGATILELSSRSYFLVTNTTSVTVQYQGAAVVAGAFNNWIAIGAEPLSGSGYEVAWFNTMTGQYWVWAANGSGNYTGDLFAAGAGNSVVLESLETSFHQDLNGDGIIGLPAGTSLIEGLGSTATVQVANNYYFDPVSGGTGPELKLGGAAFTVGTWGAWAPIATEATASGFEIAWKIGADTYTVWNTDANGNITTNATGTVSGSSTALEALETSFHQDLNGDGIIGIPAAPPSTTIEAKGATALVQTGNHYFLDPVAGGTGPDLKYGGTDFTVGTWGAWTPIGAEATATGYEVAWKIGADTYTVWNTDANGNITTNAIGTVSGSSSALEGLETSFQQDLNGDGTIGIPAAPGSTTIESKGVTALVQTGNNYFFNPVAGGTGPELKYGGAAFTAGSTWGAWAPIGAEAISGGYEVAFRLGTDTYTVWNTDANGNVTTNALPTTSGSSTALETLETSFQQDLNGDGTIGIPSHTSPAAQVASAAAATQAAPSLGGGDGFVFRPDPGSIGGANAPPPAAFPEAGEMLTLTTASAAHIDVADVHDLGGALGGAVQGAVFDPLHGFMIH